MANPYPTQFNELLNLQFEQPSKVRQKSYGLKLVKELYAGINGGADSYYSQREAQWKINETFAKGMMKPEEFIKFLGIEGTTSYVNIDPTILKIVPRYMQVLLQGFMNREERASVNATGVLSYQKKQERKTAAEYRMKNAGKIAEMQQASGMQHETGYTPQDQDELDFHYKVIDRLPEESGFEERIDEIFQNCDDENLKRELLSDIAKYNLACTKIVEINAKTRTLANRLRVKRCKPGRTVYNVFERPNGEDVSLIGEAYPITIAEGRKQFPDVAEEDWFKLAQKSSKGLNRYSNLSWLDKYNSDFYRPYDEYKFLIFDFEVKRADTEYAVKKVVDGKERLFNRAGKPNPQTGEAIETVRYNIYGGVWAVDTDIMLKWDILPNQIRPFQNGIDCFSSYSIVCPDADGSLIPSLVERGIPMVKALVDTFLKIQLMKRTMRPDGEDIDVSLLQNVDIGTGAALQPMELIKIRNQTGIGFYDSTDTSGTPSEERTGTPYQNHQYSANVAQINTLIGLYNFEVQRLNDEWGTNPDALGQQLPARRGKKVNENQIEMANQATEYIHDHFLMLKRMTANKLIMKLWDISIFEASDYKEMDGVDISELLEMQFDANIEFVPMDTDRQRLQQKIDVALEKGLISLGESIRIENMDNLKDAELYLIRLEKKAIEAQAAQQDKSIQDTLAGQQQTAALTAQNEAGLIREKAQAESFVTTGKLQQEGYNSIINMVSGVVQDCIKLNKPVPSDIQPLVTYVINTTLASQQQTEQPQQQEPPAQEQAEPQQEPQQQEMAEQPQ